LFFGGLTTALGYPEKAAVKLLRLAPNDLMHMWPVSKRVNVSGWGDDDPSLTEPVEAIAEG
jgi:hypothetical protein